MKKLRAPVKAWTGNVTFRLPEPLRSRVEAIAKAKEWTRTQVLIKAIEAGLPVVIQKAGLPSVLA